MPCSALCGLIGQQKLRLVTIMLRKAVRLGVMGIQSRRRERCDGNQVSLADAVSVRVTVYWQTGIACRQRAGLSVRDADKGRGQRALYRDLCALWRVAWTGHYQSHMFCYQAVQQRYGYTQVQNPGCICVWRGLQFA